MGLESGGGGEERAGGDAGGEDNEVLEASLGHTSPEDGDDSPAAGKWTDGSASTDEECLKGCEGLGI